MLPEWLFSARSAGSRRGCATPDAPRLLTAATEAFIDRTPIDWTALLSRVRTSPDRALLENLRAVDLVRQAIVPDRRAATGAQHRLLFIKLVVALAAVQTLCSLLLFGVALTRQADISHGGLQIALALAFSGTCALLSRAASHDPRRLCLLGTFMCAAGAFARGALRGIPEGWAAPSALVVRALAVEVFTPACLWQFALDFPRVRRFVSFDVLARRIGGAAWILGLAAFVVNLGAACHVVSESPLADLLPDRGSTVFWGLFSIVSVPAVAAIFVRSRRAPWVERKKVARFALALAAGASPFLLLGLIRTLIPEVDDWLRTAARSERACLDSLVVGALAATPILTAWAVIVDRPFESRTVGRRPWPHTFVNAGLTTLVATLFAAPVVVFYGVREAAVGHIPSGPYVWVFVGCAAAGALLLLPRVAVPGAKERRRFWRSADLHERLACALDRLRTARGAREIAAVLRREFQRGLGASSVRILIARRPGIFEDPLEVAMHLRRDAGLFALLRDAALPLDLSPDGRLLPLLSPADREWAVANAVEAAVSVRRRDGGLFAIVLLGKKRAGCVFDRRDRWFIAALTNAAAAAWNDRSQAESDTAGSTGYRGVRRDNDGEAAFECRRCGRVAGSRPPRCCGPGDPTLASLPRCLARKFIVQRRIGAGGMGVVYLARDLTLGRQVALKTLPEIRSHRVARLRAEARAMASLSHESLATIYGLELWQRIPVLVLEYFPEGTLATRLGAGPLSPAGVARLGVDLARALAFMHSHGVLHRDLKPSNIALTATGAPRILDFGLISLIEASASSRCRVQSIDDLTNSGRAGTLAYLPPEAFQHGRASQQFDLWALAVVLVEALTGVNPFAACDRVATLERVLDPDRREILSEARAALPALAGFLDRALAPKPEARFQSAAEMLAALEPLGLH